MTGFSFDSLKNAGKNFTFDELKRMGKDNALHALGLEEQSSTVESAVPLLAAFGAGLIAGLCAGMLLAPNSGEESRKQIAEGAERAQDKAKQAGQELVDKARDQVRAS